MTSTLQYAVVGTGTVGTVLAQRFSDHHVPALWANTRGPETIDVTELSASITPATLDTALDADVIILAIPFLQVRELGGRRPDWSGKIVVDATNAFLVPNSPQILGGRLSTEHNAEAFPGAAVVKSFNQTAARQLAEKRPPEFGKRVVFVSSNDSAASATVAELCTELGFAPIELGRLDEGGVLIQARNALVLRELYELPSELEKHSGDVGGWAGSHPRHVDDRPRPLFHHVLGSPPDGRQSTWAIRRLLRGDHRARERNSEHCGHHRGRVG